MKLKIARFLLVGGITSCIYFGLQYFFEIAGVSPLLSVSFAYILAITFHFLASSAYTFKVSAKSAIRMQTLVKYGFVNVLNYCINIISAKCFLLMGMPVQLGMVVGIAITTVTGFLFYEKTVFISEK